MKKTLLLTLLVVFAVIWADGKKISKGRSSSSSRGSSRKTNSKPSPTSLSYPQPNPQAAPKPSLFGWQEKPAQRTQTQSKPSKPSNTQHSYPSSQTGLSGTGQKTPSQSQAGSQTGHSYPSSNGMSGNSGGSGGYPGNTGLSGGGAGGAGYPNQLGSGHSGTGSAAGGYPTNTGLSGNGAAGGSYPKQQGSGLSGTGAAAAPPPYSAGNYQGNNAAGYPKQAPPPYSPGNYPNNNYGGGYHHQGAPPPYSNNYGGYGGHQGYSPQHTPQMPGYFGNYGGRGGFGGVSRGPSALAGVGIAGAGIGTILTGLALWNLARSTGRSHHTVIYDNRGQPVAVAPDNSTEPVVDPILGDLVNCTLTISTDNATEVLGIPCAIATSFTPDADVKDASSNNNQNDNTKCTVTVVNKAGREFMTTISCSILLNTAAENNVTEPPMTINGNDSFNETMMVPGDAVNPNQDQPSPQQLSNASAIVNESTKCSPEPGITRDPINPCFTVTQDLSVIPLNETSTAQATTPGVA